MKKVLMILNPSSGMRQANKSMVEIIRVFCSAGYTVEVAVTEKAGDATEFAKQKAGEVDLVVGIGGDGTFNEVLVGLLENGAETPIGYIPAGSTNDFAASLGLSKDVVKAAKDIVEGEPRTLDVGSFNGRIFSYVASFGAFTRASYGASQSIKNALGHMAYILEGIKDIPSIKSERLWIKMKQGTYGGKYVFGAISNSTSVGGILTLDQNLVDMNDGEFEVLLIKSPGNIIELNQIIIALTTGNFKSPMISFFSTDEVEIIADEDMPWTLDGEFQEGSSRIDVKNIHDAIRLMVPKH